MSRPRRWSPNVITIAAGSDDYEPWEQQPGETAGAFHAFAHYRDLGAARSIDKAWRQHRQQCHGVSPGHASINRRASKVWPAWASGWGWVERAELWDRHQDTAARDKMLKDQTEARARHARIAAAGLQALTVPARVVIEAIQRNPALMQELVQEAQENPRALLRLVDLATGATRAVPGLVAVERLALGLTTELVEIDDRREDFLGYNVPSDDESTELAIALLNRSALLSQGSALGPGTPGPPEAPGGALVPSPAPGLPDEEAD